MENYSYLMCTTPWGERCAQINDVNYRDNAKIEAAVYCDQLTRTLGQIPKGTYFRREWSRHEFGEYLDIRFHYDDEEQVHIIYVDKLERGIEKWDAEALEELRKAGYKLPAEKVIPLRQSVHDYRTRKGA